MYRTYGIVGTAVRVQCTVLWLEVAYYASPHLLLGSRERLVSTGSDARSPPSGSSPTLHLLRGAAKVAREHVISEAQRRAYASLIARMEAKESVLWLGLGGSHFGGRKCADKRNIGGARCSYFFQLASSLRERFYGIKTSPHDDGGPNSNLTAGLVYRNMATSGAGLSQI